MTDGMTLPASVFAVRPGKFRPNRQGVDLGLTLNLTDGELYFDFSYLQQVNPHSEN